MKKIIILLLTVVFAFNLRAQSRDFNGFTVSPFVAPNSGVPSHAASVLETKLKNIIIASGMIADSNRKFILTAHVLPLTEDVTPTAPVKYVYTLSINLYFGDGISGKEFSSYSFEAKGVGNSKERAYLAAIKSIDPNNPKIKKMIEEGQEKIVDYYVSQGPTILREAQTAARMENFDEAFYLLDQIPAACPELFAQANDLKIQIYRTYIAKEGDNAVTEATEIWNTGRNPEAAYKAGALLSGVDPLSPAYKKAEALHGSISASVNIGDKYPLQKPKTEAEAKDSWHSTIKDIAEAEGKRQPEPVYKMFW